MNLNVIIAKRYASLPIYDYWKMQFLFWDLQLLKNAFFLDNYSKIQSLLNFYVSHTFHYYTLFWFRISLSILFCNKLSFILFRTKCGYWGSRVRKFLDGWEFKQEDIFPPSHFTPLFPSFTRFPIFPFPGGSGDDKIDPSTPPQKFSTMSDIPHFVPDLAHRVSWALRSKVSVLEFLEYVSLILYPSNN